MAACLVLAIAADGQVRAVRQRREQLNEALGSRFAHLATIVARVLLPTRVGPRLGKRPAHPLLAWRQVRQPEIGEIAPGVVGLAHAARRATRRADAQPLARLARAA